MLIKYEYDVEKNDNYLVQDVKEQSYAATAV
jgi:hypothetical protein